MGNTADVAMVQNTIIDTFHKEGKSQRVITERGGCSRVLYQSVMITYNIYIVIRETGQFSSKGIINYFKRNLNRLTVSRRFTEQAV